MFSEKRAVTPVIATLLLIAITVAAVAGFYIFYQNFIRQQNVGGKEASVTISGTNNAAKGDVVTVTIKNTGNVDLLIASGGLTLPKGALADSWSPASWWVKTTSPLSPGDVISGSRTLGAADGTSHTWQLSLIATTSGGSSVQDILVINEA